MKLSYRGVSYDYIPPTVETTQSEVVGKYRGLDWRFCAVKKAPVQQTNLDLKYRGVAYNTNGKTSGFSVSEKARQAMIARQRSAMKRQQAMLTRLSAEVC